MPSHRAWLVSQECWAADPGSQYLLMSVQSAAGLEALEVGEGMGPLNLNPRSVPAFSGALFEQL